MASRLGEMSRHGACGGTEPGDVETRSVMFITLSRKGSQAIPV
jgi:hypothetical protein